MKQRIDKKHLPLFHENGIVVQVGDNQLSHLPFWLLEDGDNDPIMFDPSDLPSLEKELGIMVGANRANLLGSGYECIRRPSEGTDSVWQKGDFRVFAGWDTDHVYLPALSIVGRAMRGPKIEYMHELEMFEKIYNNEKINN